MINGIEIKVCGLTRLSDAMDAATLGVDYLGFNFFKESPRFLSYEDYRSIAGALPHLPKVAIAVAPDVKMIADLQALGMDYFQLHYPALETSRSQLREWSKFWGPDRLSLAPRIAPHDRFDEDALELAGTWLLDAYKKGVYGGTGKIGDWGEFARLSREYPEKTWILAGGLGPDNVREALSETGAKRIDLNSGIEESPGIKDLSKLELVRNELEAL